MRGRPKRTKKVRPLEGDVQAAILKLLRTLGVVHWRVNGGAARMVGKGGRVRPIRFVGIDGHADIALVLKGGRAAYIEVKRPGGKQNDNQVEFQRIVTGAGAGYAVCESTDQVIETLRGWGEVG